MEKKTEGVYYSSQTAIRDPIWKHIWISNKMLEITRTKPFLRLYRIKQLGPTEYIYPGATHTRASHSLGVYHIAKRILDVLLKKGADQWTSPLGVKSFLAACLLHDLGHFPYTHSLKELPLEEHETLSARLLKTPEMQILLDNFGADPDMTSHIIDVHETKNIDTETIFFRHLLSGVLDPDKIDYLNRDAYFCGVPYGLQDTDFILSQIYPDKENGIQLSTKGLIAIENILFSKYLMYKSVYWHRQVRIATAMIKKMLFHALKKKIIVPEELYNLDDEGLYILLESKSFPEKKLGHDVRKRKFYQIIGELKYTSLNNHLEDLNLRSNLEEKTADFLSHATQKTILPIDIIIDIPEKISFENNLNIYKENSIISQNYTVFTNKVIQDFTHSLRIIRVAIAQDKYTQIGTIKDMSEKLANCLGLDYTKD